jgi:hypothetical protein
MFGQTFNNLPPLCARTFRKGSHKLVFKVVRIVPWCASAHKGWNLQQVFAQTFWEDFANLRPRVAQTFRFLFRKPSPKVAQASAFKMIPALPSDVVKKHICADTGSSKIYQVLPRGIRFASCAWSSIFGFRIVR